MVSPPGSLVFTWGHPEMFAQHKFGFINLVWLAYYISGSRFPSTRNETSFLPQTRLGGRGVQWMETALEAATYFSGHLTCFTVTCSLPLGHFDVTTLGLLLSSAVAKEKPHKICFVFLFFLLLAKGPRSRSDFRVWLLELLDPHRAPTQMSSSVFPSNFPCQGMPSTWVVATLMISRWM